MRNIAALLKSAGAGFEHVVRTTVFLADMNEFAAMNERYAKFVTDPPPARATVQVARLPRDVKSRNRRDRGDPVGQSQRLHGSTAYARGSFHPQHAIHTLDRLDHSSRCFTSLISTVMSMRAW